MGLGSRPVAFKVQNLAMNRRLLSLTGLGLALAGVSIALVSESSRRLWPVTVSSASANLLKEPRHPVSPLMSQRSSSLQGKSARILTLDGAASNTINVGELLGNGPVILVFTKDGCPCSIEAQPYFNALAKAYKGTASFVGVIDSNRHEAVRYMIDFDLAYDLACATDRTIFDAFDAKRSVYVTLLGKDGRIVRQWPGYSKTMLEELSETIAAEAKVEVQTIDVSKAPLEMNSGCPFEPSTPDGE